MLQPIKIWDDLLNDEMIKITFNIDREDKLSRDIQTTDVIRNKVIIDTLIWNMDF